MSGQADPRSPEVNPKSPRNAPWWVKAFVVFHIIAITIWALPNPPEGYANGDLKLGIDPNSPGGIPGSLSRLITDAPMVWKANYGRDAFFKYYTLSTGFWQYWDMFAPNPIGYDVYCTADVRFADDTYITYKYPRMYDLDVFRKYLGERYRKFFERVNGMPFTWSYFVRHIADLCEAKYHKKVLGVKLWSHQFLTPPPDQPFDVKYTDRDFFVATHILGSWQYYQHQGDKWVAVQE